MPCPWPGSGSKYRCKMARCGRFAAAAPQVRQASSSPFHQNETMKSCLFPPGGVARPGTSYGYVASTRLARRKNPSISFCSHFDEADYQAPCASNLPTCCRSLPTVLWQQASHFEPVVVNGCSPKANHIFPACLGKCLVFNKSSLFNFREKFKKVMKSFVARAQLPHTQNTPTMFCRSRALVTKAVRFRLDPLSRYAHQTYQHVVDLC